VYASPPEISCFEIETFHYLRDLVVENNIHCDWLSTTSVHGLYTENLVDRAARNLAKLAATYPHLAESACLVTQGPPSDPSLPTLRELGVPDARAAVVLKHAASLWPYKLVAWVLKELLAAESEGSRSSESEQGWFNLQTGTVVTEVQRVEDSWIVHTERGQVAAENVLLACNGYVSNLLPDFTGLIEPVQGQVASLRSGATRLGHTYIFLAEPPDGPVMDDYLVQAISGEKELVLGGGRVLGNAKGRGVSDDDFIDETVSHHLRTILPAVLDMHSGEDLPEGERAEMDASFEWTGIMGYSVDGRPWVGAVPETLGGGPGLYIAAGYTGHGMPVAALSARAVVSMMGGQKKDHIPQEYVISPERIGRVRSTPRLKGELLDEMVMDQL